MGALTPKYDGAWDAFLSIDLDESEETVKLAPGHVGGWHIWNDSAAVVYVKLYDALIGDVTVGTTTPRMVVGVPTLGGAVAYFRSGVFFETAISAAATTDVGGNGAPAANDVVMNLLFA